MFKGMADVFVTPPQFYIAPEKRWLEDYFPFWMVPFQGRAVKLRGSSFLDIFF